MGKGLDTYEHEYELKQDLNIPSYQKRKQYILDLWKDDNVLVEYVGKDTINEYKKYFNSSDKDALNIIRSDLSKLGEDGLAKAMSANIGGRKKALESLQERAIKDGYNAFIDDSGTVFSEMPLMIFDPNNNMSETNSTHVGGINEMTAYDNAYRKSINKNRKFRNNFKTLRARDNF